MPKRDVLEYVERAGEVTSYDIAVAFGMTLPGAASTLLWLTRQGKLRRRRAGTGYLYRLSQKGAEYLDLFQ